MDIFGFIKNLFCLNKKGQVSAFESMGTIGLALVTGVLALAIGTQVMSQTGSLFSANTTALNLTNQGQQSTQNFANFLPIMGLVGIAVVVLAVVQRFRT